MSEEQTPTNSTPTALSNSPSSTSIAVPNRSDLIQKARAFLQSPQVRNEDYAAKRIFLSEKGLNDIEIDSLLQETVFQPPVVPPRTYPQPPPSNLPNLLIGLARILSWLAGGSAAFLLLYFRYIFPRLSQSFQARLSIRSHQKELLRKLTESLTDLKANQSRTFEVLPEPRLYKEDDKYKDCHSLEDLAPLSEDVRELPATVLLRCSIEDLAAKSEPVTDAAIFAGLESNWPWLQSDEGSGYMETIWNTLHTTPLFAQEQKDDVTLWSYTPPAPTPPTALETSLSTLRATLPPARTSLHPFQHTLQALTDFTGYIASQTYAIPSTLRFSGIGMNTPLPPGEEEVRREIRALKGLVLNRRSFLPSTPKLPSELPTP
ncbi:hypothetical protein QCA50_000004 [Cerrena zonata]|uniref:Peroxisomal membrane protein PEX14 n=1 Tax=Cerrena zonata TaxID=2478898 RepID=A0AAW0GTU8_9APHY